MIRLILVVLAIAVSLALSPMLIGEVGYVLISFNKTTIEGSIVAFCATFLVIALGVYLTYKLFCYIWSLYSNTRHRFFARSEERKHAAIEQAVWSLVNDDYDHMELSLKSNRVAQPWQDVRYAMLAKAALHDNDTNKAIDLLDNISAKNQLKVATLWLATGQSNHLGDEFETAATSKKATKLELKLYADMLIQQKQWQQVQKILSRLMRTKALTEQQWQQLFDAYFAEHDADKLTESYQALPKAVKDMAYISYLRAMVKVGKIADIELELLKMLKKPAEHAKLAYVLRESTVGDALKLQTKLQEVLKKEPENSALLLSLACLANTHGEYELAARVFDKALNGDNYSDYLQQAVLSYSKSGQPEKALILYQ